MVQHLDKMGAGASSIGDTFFFLRENATTSEMFEEIYHFKQAFLGDYENLSFGEMILRREIDAQKYLLGATN